MFLAFAFKEREIFFRFEPLHVMTQQQRNDFQLKFLPFPYKKRDIFVRFEPLHFMAQQQRNDFQWKLFAISL